MTAIKVDLSGQRFGSWLVQCFEARAGWRCTCACGATKVIDAHALTRGFTRGCRSCMGRRSRRHSEGTKPIVLVLRTMKQRCENPKNPAFKNYGARGISVCAEWSVRPEAFVEWALANGYAAGLSIDRIDNDGNYEPHNCRWATRAIQNRNTRRNRLIAHEGRAQTIADWADEAGIDRDALRSRLRKGWPVARALSQPAHPRRPKHQMIAEGLIQIKDAKT